MSRLARVGQRGSILAAVVVVIFFCVLAGSQLLSHGSGAESRSVEESLARSRAYWAMNGHWAYALSRANAVGLCTVEDGFCEKDDSASETDDRVESVTVFLEELHDLPASGPLYRRWLYSDYASGDYYYDVSTTVYNSDESAAESNDGHLKFEIRLVNVGASRLLEGIEARILDMQVDACFGLSNLSIDDCQIIGFNGADDQSGKSKVTALKRIPNE